MSQSNTSNIDSQRNIRVQKMNLLKELGFDPFPVTSYKSHTIGFIKFWFALVHKFDFAKIGLDEANYLVEYYLYQGVFPPTLLEVFEEKIHLRRTARQMGIDPDDSIEKQDISFDEEIVSEIRSLLPTIGEVSKVNRELYYDQFLIQGDSDGVNKYEEEEMIKLGLQKNQMVTVCGRIKTKRLSGKIAFCVLEDESCPDGLQIILKKDSLEIDSLSQIKSAFSKLNLEKYL
jgi:lysyl-tRNA synthetase class II